MKYRRIGRSGLKVSEITLGSWYNFDSAHNLENHKLLIKTAYEAGINSFDCANIYGSSPHAAEKVISQSLQPYPRENYILSTKVFWPVGDEPNQKGLNRKHIITEVDKSLTAFKTDYIDIFYCHRYDTETDLEETLRTIDGLIKQGKILYAGTSQWRAYRITRASMMQKMLGFHSFVVNQPSYNLLNRYIENEVIPACEELGVGQIVYQGLAQGILTGKYNTGDGGTIPPSSRGSNISGLKQLKSSLNADTLGKVDKVCALAKELNVTPAQLALAWILQHRGISSVVIGASQPQQLLENIKSVDISLDENTLESLNNL